MRNRVRFLLMAGVAGLLFTSCAKEYSYEGSEMAVFTFNDCNSTQVLGTYAKDGSLDSTNRIIISVDVTKIGKWSVSVSLSNGIAFSGLGIFTAKGAQTIILQGKGKPAAAGVFTADTGSGGAGCAIRITVTANGTGIPVAVGDNQWQFTEGGRVYKGHFIAASLITPVGSQVLGANGAVAFGDSSLSMYMTDVSSDIATYKSYNSLAPRSANRFTFDFSRQNSGNSLYQAGLGGNNPADLTATITSIDKTLKKAEGIFSGTVRDESGGIRSITNGQFKFNYN
jgi:hypothetical protein